jgi:hypothetical protein
MLQLDPSVPPIIQPYSVNFSMSQDRVDFEFENRWDVFNPNFIAVTLGAGTYGQGCPWTSSSSTRARYGLPLYAFWVTTHETA